MRRLLTYKGMQPAKSDAIWCKKYSPGPFGLCAMAVREEVVVVEEEEDKTWKFSRAHCELKLAMCTIQSPLLNDKLRLMDFCPI